jgi:hypothetical protein
LKKSNRLQSDILKQTTNVKEKSENSKHFLQENIFFAHKRHKFSG